MKLTKIAYVALSAALVFGAKSTAVASAYYTTQNYLKLSFNLQVQTQNPYVYNGGKYIYSYNTMKLVNKDVLNLLATMTGQTWPAGAQLEYDFNSYQLVVADSTGTNILFYAGDGIDTEGYYGYWDFDPFDTESIYSGQYASYQSSGTETYSEFYSCDFEFYDDYYYYDLYGGGATSESYNYTWTSKKNTGFDDISTTLTGGGNFNDNNRAFITGTVLGVEQFNNLVRPSLAIHAGGHSKN